MSSIDQQFVEYIVKSLVGNPEKVQVDRTIDEKGVLLELTVDPNDLGRVIGKRGATAQSLRTLLRALGTKNDARYNLKIVDNSDGPPPRREDRNDDKSAQPDEDTSATADDKTAVVSDNDDAVVDEMADNAVEETPEESSVASRTRKELADLDDLDV